MDEVMTIPMTIDSTPEVSMDVDMSINVVSGAVNSVNGQTGDVVLTASDVGALPGDTTYVSSFNGASGAVTYSAPVTSVNNKTGSVALTASDVGAMASDAHVVMYESQTLTDAQKAQARDNINAISADEIGTVFNIKGDVPTYNDLPQTGNVVGDVYYVSDVSAGFVWLETTDHPSGYWEELGEPIDLSGYIEKPQSPSTGQYLQWDGSAWSAFTIPTATTSTTGLMSATDKSHLDDLYADYSSALVALGVIT